ncbi:hypothetical protein SEA_MOLIVIA_95 [Arthrobacter phage Molivia]|uniref:Uncharacterized protein n=1 Tax=Arthrobacter phage Molivia TaxID=2015839 RepID=A0A286N4C5_9CAUD|nr:hypothetical protein FDI28_gp01 [Arthrobacter phage Molivia]YP_009610217.1 hypothetical protein FDI28_gp21 [Arthrobacter phage Molivia]ASX99232.1 hypothetical protein SEA_MOLIVIA_1 [Arthrobacter phage Molivia]ASX99316.1 hypothetical protein SEA_MOLIVIA_95 [Arthrobacter phage Molivia]
MKNSGPRVKIEIAHKQGRRRLTTFLRADNATTWDDIQRAAEWQANLVGVPGGFQQHSREIRPVLAHKLYYRGATQTITEMP